MATNENNPRAAQRVRNVEGLKLQKTYKASVTTASQDMPTLLAEALNADVGAITINNQSGNTVHIQNGTATTSHGEIANGQTLTIHGRKDELDLYEMIAGSASTVSFYQWTSI
jgi:hypothetical protein